MLGPKMLDGLEKRGISAETADLMRLFSGTRNSDGSVCPDPNGNILCIPFYENDDAVAIKYRTRGKDGERLMWAMKGGISTWYNCNVILNDEVLLELETGTARLIITEGEIDALSAIQAGYWHAMSVPNGAPPARRPDGTLIEDTGDRDFDKGVAEKFRFMDRHVERLARVKEFVIAVDADEPGQRLKKELVRRLGEERCLQVQYPEGCKDLNDVLRQHGIDGVRDVVDGAKPFPIEGVFDPIKDFDFEEVMPTFTTGFQSLDPLMKFIPGTFMVVTGVPGVSKSTLINQMVINAARVHGWRSLVFSGEMPPSFLARNWMAAAANKPFARLNPEERRAAGEFVSDHVRIIHRGRSRNNRTQFTVDFILDRAERLVTAFGIKILVIDPWNEVEHDRPRNLNETEYIGLAIVKLKDFAAAYGVQVIVIAHPTKPSYAGEELDLYAISSSANWNNKADIGMIIQPPDGDMHSLLREIRIKKIRFQPEGGKPGKVLLQFDQESRLYFDIGDKVRPDVKAQRGRASKEQATQFPVSTLRN